MRLGIVQAPIRRASSGAGLSVALYAPCRHLQQPATALEKTNVIRSGRIRAVRQNYRRWQFGPARTSSYRHSLPY